MYRLTKKDIKRGKKINKHKKAINKMVIGSPYLSIIILNVNALNSPIKVHRVADQIIKTEPNYVMPSRDSLKR